MALKATIEGEIKTAMLAKDKDRLRALRSIKSLIMLAETEKGVQAELTEDAEMAILVKAAKQRKDSLDVFEKQGRQDLADIEKQELGVIEEFLPKQMSEDEIRTELEKIVNELGASSIKEMGKVMGVASKKMAGKADNKKVSEIIKSLLS
ncbi:MAG: GatB/YqeY domain-containing protein [Cyclobacteriaceae bacterium]